MRIQGVAQRGLCGQQAKAGAAILLQDELREGRTQDALAVEHDDGAVIREARHCRIGSIFVRRGLHWSYPAETEAAECCKWPLIEVNRTSKSLVEINT